MLKIKRPFDIKKKGLVPHIRGQEGLKSFIRNFYELVVQNQYRVSKIPRLVIKFKLLCIQYLQKLPISLNKLVLIYMEYTYNCV